MMDRLKRAGRPGVLPDGPYVDFLLDAQLGLGGCPFGVQVRQGGVQVEAVGEHLRTQLLVIESGLVPSVEKKDAGR